MSDTGLMVSDINEPPSRYDVTVTVTAVPRSFLGVWITIRGGCCDVIMSGAPGGGR